ncbi:MAG: hypothetical protein SNG27_02075 [Rikenellaceae bacterium]
MEHKERIRLTTTSSFDLERDEIKHLYTYLSLFQYRWLRIPDYRERVLIETLQKDFKKFYVEMQTQTERDPNNLTLNRIRAFFDIHHKRLKELTNEYKASDKECGEDQNSITS